MDIASGSVAGSYILLDCVIHLAGASEDLSPSGRPAAAER